MINSMNLSKKNKLNYIDFNIKYNKCKLIEYIYFNNCNQENLKKRKEYDKYT